MSEAESLELPSGARLDYFVAGQSGDALLIYHHGTPAAGPLSPDMVAAAQRQGLVLA